MQNILNLYNRLNIPTTSLTLTLENNVDRIIDGYQYIPESNKIICKR